MANETPVSTKPEKVPSHTGRRKGPADCSGKKCTHNPPTSLENAKRLLAALAVDKIGGTVK